ncbi:MAG: copper-binding protein [Candidatus Rokubacteria bacterium]|nr:copper-binding protein [Candidatus Rokubacteria bacterium]
MRPWKVALVLNLALAVGVGWGYAWWGRRADRLAAEVVATHARAERLERELAAARAAAPGAGAAGQQWQVRGVVRAVLPEIDVVVITHEDIPGFMPSMTMGFRAATPELHETVRVGDTARFTLRGTPPDVVITAIEAAKRGGSER